MLKAHTRNDLADSLKKAMAMADQQEVGHVKLTHPEVDAEFVIHVCIEGVPWLSFEGLSTEESVEKLWNDCLIDEHDLCRISIDGLSLTYTVTQKMADGYYILETFYKEAVESEQETVLTELEALYQDYFKDAAARLSKA